MAPAIRGADMPEPIHTTPMEELRHTQDELHFERGVMFALREFNKGRTFESLFIESMHRIEVLESKAERLKRMVR